MKWRPLSMRADPSATDEYDVLHDGVPQWLASGIVEWLRDALQTNVLYGEDPAERLRVLEQTLRFPLDWRFGGLGTLLDEVASNGDRALDIVDPTVMVTTPDRAHLREPGRDRDGPGAVLHLRRLRPRHSPVSTSCDDLDAAAEEGATLRRKPLGGGDEDVALSGEFS